MSAKLFGVTLLCFSLASFGCASDTGEQGDVDTSSDDLTSAEGEGVAPSNEDPPEPFDDVTEEEVAAEDAAIGAELATASSSVSLQGGAQAAQASQVIARALYAEASAYFKKNKARIPNQRYYAVVDFSKHNGQKRFYIVDGSAGTVESHVVAHGSGSDPNKTGYTKYLSNVDGSRKSSEGAYLTSRNGVYSFRGRALRMDGLSSTNSAANARGILLHRGVNSSGTTYVSDGFARQGNSWGCFAMDPRFTDSVVDKLKNGALIYAKKTF
jgi:L,D-transpeptidase catalytic domain